MVRSRMVHGVWLLAAAVVWFACGDDSDGTDAGHSAEHNAEHNAEHDASHGGTHDMLCGDQANCTDTVDLADGLEGESASGTFMAKIMSQNGLNVDDNEWMVMVTDADGAAVEEATVSVQTFSVDCGHEGPCPPADAVEHMPGMYMITPVHAHGGPWDTIVSVAKGGDSDEITWHFCVDAPGHGSADLPVVTCPDGSEADTSHAGHNPDGGEGGHDAGHMM